MEEGSPGRDFIVNQPDPYGAEDRFEGAHKGCKCGGYKPHAGCEHGKTHAQIEGAKGNEPAEISGAYEIMAGEHA